MRVVFVTLLRNKVIFVSLLSWAAAQILKTLFNLAITRKFKLERLFGAGGMPSGHSALVSSLVISMAKTAGLDSPEFAFSILFAGIVMYDAMGVRRAAGEQAKAINKYFLNMGFFGEDPPECLQTAPPKKKRFRVKKDIGHRMLKEFIGHTPLEVMCGGMLGIIIAMIAMN
ncbi:MAG: divergent PAP2 family protein [Oscillospiraceae bacterium]|jgi:acid phosphatase family membrane protein YuiD|nr:divergent PAP2 family protein [Oscillospiraceae bacterium]